MATQQEKRTTVKTTRNGESEYRSFKLVKVNNVELCEIFQARNKREVGSQTSLGPSRAASKIFTSYRLKHEVKLNEPTHLEIVEMTQGKPGKTYEYVATVEEMKTPEYFEKVTVNGEVKLVKIASLDDAQDKNNVIVHKYKTSIRTVREK